MTNTNVAINEELVFGDMIKVVSNVHLEFYDNLIGKELMVIESDKVDDEFTFIHVAGTEMEDPEGYMQYGEAMLHAVDCVVVSKQSA